MTFIAPHLPHLAQLTSPLRDLLKELTPWTWNDDHQTIFEKVKQLVSTNICLQYYDPNEEVHLEVDASIKGLGAALVQNNKHVAFASKALTSAQANYSNIERECLAVVYGIQRFHNYLYGRPFTVISDHKPIEVIMHKSLQCAPTRIQRMMTKIQGYDFKVTYIPGPKVIMADTLSRLPNSNTSEDVLSNDHVHGISISECTIIDIDLLNFSPPPKQSEIRQFTTIDPVLKTLSETIYTGWPDNIQQLPSEGREYWSYRDELTLQNGIILKDHQVVIPEQLRCNILLQLHTSHQGIDKTKKLARESI